GAVAPACRVRLHETGEGPPEFGCRPAENQPPGGSTRPLGQGSALRSAWVRPIPRARRELQDRSCFALCAAANGTSRRDFPDFLDDCDGRGGGCALEFAARGAPDTRRVHLPRVASSRW